MATSLPPPIDLKSLKLADFKQIAKRVSIDTKGKKTDLLLRLESCSSDAITHAYSCLGKESSTPVSSDVPVLCPVCDKRFTHKPGEESILYEGFCQAWYHRCCAGLTKSAFNELSVFHHFLLPQLSCGRK
uniref:SAP domain-containing protein n=1 Tax=Amphimedon queenslandica TaxID=400682 RepID=A0A1X7TZQ6_AMPQE